MPIGKQEQYAKKKAKSVENKTLEQYKESVSAANRPDENITRGTIRVTGAERRLSRGEELRYREKARLKELLPDYYEAVQGDPQLEKILQAVRYYAGMNVTSTTGSYAEEGKALNDILNALRYYQKKLDEQAKDAKHDTLTDYARQRVVASLLTQLETNTDGNLEVGDTRYLKAEDREPGAYYVDGTKKPYVPSSDTFYVDIKYKDAPLFPHEPCANDISQGYLGDCYFVASLAEIADRQPEKIKDAMHDNGNGTVTVRFYATEKGKDNKYTYKPVYVTVDKVVPSYWQNRESVYADDCLWVQTLERAYAASGLHVFTQTSKGSEYGFYDTKEALPQLPVPENIDEMYRKIKSGELPKPTHDACPWLVDEKGQLHEWKPSYTSIEGGFGTYAMQAMLGPDYEPSYYMYRDERDSYYVPTDTPEGEHLSGQICFNIFNDMYLESRKNASRSEIAAYRKLEDSRRDAANMMMLYEKITGEKCPTFTMHGPNESYEWPDFVNHPEVLSMINGLQAVNAFVLDISRQARTFGDRFAELFNDPENGFRATIEKFKNSEHGLSQENQTKLNQLMDGFGDILSERMMKLNEKYAKYPKYEGKYNRLEQELLKRIQDAKAGGKMMLCSTGQEGRETDTSFGLRKNHQYTAIDTIKRKVNGKDLWFVRLRNPHAQNIMTYKVENGTMTPQASPRKDEGYFDIELSDFTTNFDSFIYGEPTPERQAELAKQPKAPEEEYDITADEIKQMEDERKTLHAYDRALESIQKALENSHFSLSSDSGEFKDLEKSIMDARITLAGSGEKPDLKAVMESIDRANQAYQQHVSQHPRRGSRRANRVEISRGISKLVAMQTQGVTDPKAALKEELAEKMISSAENILSNSKKPADKEKYTRLQQEDGRRTQKEKIITSKKLEKIIGSDFISLFANTGKSAVTLAKMAEGVDAVADKKQPAVKENIPKEKEVMKTGLF